MDLDRTISHVNFEFHAIPNLSHAKSQIVVNNFITGPIKREVVHYAAIALLSVAAPPLVPVAELTYNVLTYGKPAYTIISNTIELRENKGNTFSHVTNIAVATADMVMANPTSTATNYTTGIINARLSISKSATYNTVLDRLIFEPVLSNAFSYEIDVITGDATRNVFYAATSMAS